MTVKDKATDEKAATDEVTAKGKAPSELSTSDAPDVAEVVETEPLSYVHLADGSIHKCKTSEVPASGHWQKSGKLYVIVGVYPAEETVGKE